MKENQKLSTHLVELLLNQINKVDDNTVSITLFNQMGDIHIKHTHDYELKVNGVDAKVIKVTPEIKIPHIFKKNDSLNIHIELKDSIKHPYHLKGKYGGLTIDYVYN